MGVAELARHFLTISSYVVIGITVVEFVLSVGIAIRSEVCSCHSKLLIV